MFYMYIYIYILFLQNYEAILSSQDGVCNKRVKW